VSEDFGLLSYVSIFDLHRTRGQATKLFGEDCFEWRLRRTIKELKETVLICVRCPNLCFIIDGDENYQEWFLNRRAAKMGITVDKLKQMRAGLIKICPKCNQEYEEDGKFGLCSKCSTKEDKPTTME